jgi:NitT/TauT family transport system ATP-binding protein
VRPAPGAPPREAPRFAQPVIALRDVSKSFRRDGASAPVPALARVSLAIEGDSFVSLVGPSGCGKTTLLRLINGLVAPDAGEVLVDGAPPRPGPRMSFVFQSFRLIPWATVADNVGFALDVNGAAPALRRERVAHYVELVGLSRFAGAYPNELSGGMKQRAALARALATEPEILLMDEPFASIDAQTRELMQYELLRIWGERRGVVVFVTHSVDEAVLLADRVLLMGPRPGRILESFDVPLPRPRWDYDVRARPEFVELRGLLWERIRAMVVSDPDSDFFQRLPGPRRTSGE